MYIVYIFVDDADVCASCGLRRIRVFGGCIGCRFVVVVVYSSVVLYFLFVGPIVIIWFVLCIVGSFGGWYCRRLFVVWVDLSGAGSDGNVRSVGGGSFSVGGDAGLCAGRGVHWVVGRAVYVCGWGG